MSLGSFSLEIQKWVDKAGGNMDKVVRTVALDLFTRVIMKSPADTGRFKGSWQVAIGSIPNGTIEIDDKTGLVTIAKATAATMRMKAGEVIYLVNHQPYGPALEYGRSKQAPAGMVRTTVQGAGAVVRRAAGAVNK